MTKVESIVGKIAGVTESRVLFNSSKVKLTFDAPAIALADVELAMGVGGTDVAMETADVVLMPDNLSRIAYAYTLSKATVRNMKQNMFFAVGTVVLLLIDVLLGKVFLAFGMLIHELNVFLVVVNAVRLVKHKQKERKVIHRNQLDIIPEMN